MVVYLRALQLFVADPPLNWRILILTRLFHRILVVTFEVFTVLKRTLECRPFLYDFSMYSKHIFVWGQIFSSQ